MDILEITLEYKFKKGGSIFHITEGEGLKVKLSNSNIIVGTLVKVRSITGSFDLETDNGIITINCENVIDIIIV